jgi:hypothetical protein
MIVSGDKKAPIFIPHRLHTRTEVLDSFEGLDRLFLYGLVYVGDIVLIDEHPEKGGPLGE